jgi:hypothetical protein
MKRDGGEGICVERGRMGGWEARGRDVYGTREVV